MAPINTRHQTAPLDVPRTRRKHPVRNMTSLPAGKVVPLVAVPLLREDEMSGTFTAAFEMQETVEILLNGIDVVVDTWLIPNLAFERFRTMDDINLAYTGNIRPGMAAVPYFETGVAGDPALNQIHVRLGKHARASQVVNWAYVEAYNLLVNFDRSEVSPNIPQRTRLDKSLAQALWPTNIFSHIVPDFDQAVMEGEVALNIAEQNLVLRGPVGHPTYLDVAGTPTIAGAATGARSMTMEASNRLGHGGAAVGAQNITTLAGLRADVAGAVAQLADNGITISLANIDMARKAQVFANIRKKYNGLTEDMLRDLLMDGISIPEQTWRQPTKLNSVRTQFGMAKRYASNGDALTQSVVNGAAALSWNVKVPRVPCGGVIMCVAYIAPEQLFERQEDPYLTAIDPGKLPSFIPDHLDPEAVEVVYNDYIDNDHDTPGNVYGYAPQNHKWNTAGPGIGGRFYRPAVDAGFDEDRQSLWAVETQNPTLTKDAYLVPDDIHLKPFWTSTIDPFDCVTGAQIIITGNTQFGPLLIEQQTESDYDAILDRVEQDRIEKVNVPA